MKRDSCRGQKKLFLVEMIREGLSEEVTIELRLE